MAFRERNANDNSYIARYVKQYLEDGIDFSASQWPIKTRIQVRTGSLTDYLRHQWGLIKNRDAGDKHHAQDAIVIACATQGMVQKLSGLSAVFENKEAFRKRKAEELGHEKAEAWYKYIKRQIQEPWSGFRAEVMNKLDQVLFPARHGKMQPAPHIKIRFFLTTKIKAVCRFGTEWPRRKICFG